MVIGLENVAPSGDDLSSIVVSVHNKPGALHDLLKPFQKYSVDLTRLESRPSRNSKWSYVSEYVMTNVRDNLDRVFLYKCKSY